MRKVLIAVLFWLWAAPAFALVCPSVPNIFSNGTVADANQVNANFTALLNCFNTNVASSGANTNITSLLGLSSITVSGTATIGGNASVGGFFTGNKLVSVPSTVACDGSTDDTTALSNFFGSITSNTTISFPGGVTCIFKSVLTLPFYNNLVWLFNGSTLKYTGANTNTNLVQGGLVGNTGGGAAGCSLSRWTIRDLTISSATVMTGGDGFVISDGCDFHIDHIVVGNGLNGNNNLYNGAHINGGNTVYITNYSFRGSNNDELVNGDGASGGNLQATDLFHNMGNLANGGNIGLHVGGNCGGCSWDNTDVVGNYKNVLIDQSQVAIQNRQVRFGPNFASDGLGGGGTIGVDLEDPGASGSQLFCIGCWISTAADCLNIGAAVNWEIHLIGARIENCPTEGISVGSGSVRLIVDGGAIAQNGTGIYNNPSAGAPFINIQARPAMYGNSVADETGMAPTVASGCGGAGATVTGDDQSFLVTWGAVAGTSCVVNWKTAHSKSATQVTVMPQGVSVYASVGTSNTAQLGINTSANVSTGQTLLVGVGGAGF